jgi:RNA polymerase sigma-70 factor, ECF subfamily
VPGQRALLDRFAAAFEDADSSALAELLAEDVALEMPPVLTWFTGRRAVVRFLAGRQPDLFTVPGRVRMVPAMANGQPAFAAYLHDEGGVYRAYAVMVLSSTPAGIARIVIFLDPGVFGLFGLPQERGGDVAGPAPQDLAVPPWPR